MQNGVRAHRISGGWRRRGCVGAAAYAAHDRAAASPDAIAVHRAVVRAVGVTRPTLILLADAVGHARAVEACVPARAPGLAKTRAHPHKKNVFDLFLCNTHTKTSPRACFLPTRARTRRSCPPCPPRLVGPYMKRYFLLFALLMQFILF